tara:strand:- start:2545 stop:2736 length:192 start_codon:yes stop_codon:yes gene_type:complete
MGIGTVSIIFNIYLTYHINAILKQNDWFKERNITLNDEIVKAKDDQQIVLNQLNQLKEEDDWF